MWRSALLLAGLVMAATVVANPVSRQVGYSEDIQVTVENNTQDAQETIPEAVEEATVLAPAANEAVDDEAGAAVDETVTVIPDTDAPSGGQDAAAGAQIKTAADEGASGSVSGPPPANETQTSEDAGPEPVKRTDGTAAGEAAPPPEEGTVEDTTAEIDAAESSTLAPLGGQGEEGETVDSATSNGAPVAEASVSDASEDTDGSSPQADVADPDASPATNGSQAAVNTKSTEDTTDAPTDVVEGDAPDAEAPPAQEDAQANASESLAQVIRADGNSSEPATEQEEASQTAEASEAIIASPSQGPEEEEDPSQGVTELITRANDDPAELQGAEDAAAGDTPAEDITVLPLQETEVDEPESVTITIREVNEDTTESSGQTGEGESPVRIEAAMAEATDGEGTASPTLLEAQESLPEEITEASVDVTFEQTAPPPEDASLAEAAVESNSTDEATESSAAVVVDQSLAEQIIRTNEDTTDSSPPAGGEETHGVVEANEADTEPESGTAPPSEGADAEAIEETTDSIPEGDGGEGEIVEAAVAEENTTEPDASTSDAETSQKRTAGSAGLVKVSVNGETYHELPSPQQVSTDDKGEGSPGNDYWLKMDQETPEQEAEKEFEKVAEKYGLRPAANANPQDSPAEKQEASPDDSTGYFSQLRQGVGNPAARFFGDFF